MMTLVTPHFSVEEFACHDGTPYPQGWVKDRLQALCGVLEALRTELGGRTVHVVSGYRTERWNEAVGGAALSQHVEGRAADITVAGATPLEVRETLLALFAQGKVEIGGLGLYPTHVHVDTRTRPPSGHLARW